MALMNVNPTRMELSRLKKKLAVATRGHKLMKDKRDELMRRFLEIVKENKELRIKVEKSISKANEYISKARSTMQREALNTALMMPKQEIRIDVSTRNIMSVDVPVFELKTRSENSGDIYSYGYAYTSGELDAGVGALAASLPDILNLCALENATQLMASEIEKTRRRVNALEHVMIPDLKDTIRFITMKLDENERANQTRLMKVKDMMVKEQFDNSTSSI